MPRHDLNHIHAKVGGKPSFFMVVDLIERSFASQGVGAEARFHEKDGRHWMHFRVAPETKDEVVLLVRADQLPQGSGIRNLCTDVITGPGTEPVAAVLRELISRFGGDWEERDYYTARKIDLPKIEKVTVEKYGRSDRIMAAVEIAEAVGFDSMENFLDLLNNRAKSIGLAEVIAKYGPSIGHREAEGSAAQSFC